MAKATVEVKIDKKRMAELEALKKERERKSEAWQQFADRLVDQTADRVLQMLEKGRQSLVLEKVRDKSGDSPYRPIFIFDYEAILNHGYTPEEARELIKRAEKAVIKEIEAMPPQSKKEGENHE